MPRAESRERSARNLPRADAKRRKPTAKVRQPKTCHPRDVRTSRGFFLFVERCSLRWFRCTVRRRHGEKRRPERACKSLKHLTRMARLEPRISLPSPLEPSSSCVDSSQSCPNRERFASLQSADGTAHWSCDLPFPWRCTSPLFPPTSFYLLR